MTDATGTPPRQLTRRGFLGGAAAGATILALPGARPASARAAGAAVHAESGVSAAGTHEADVVVVGAGFAGIAAAETIVAAGRSVLVVEARDRVGGRVWNAHLPDGQPIEIGGQWVGPTQDRLYAWAEQVGVDTFPTHDQGAYVDYRNGMRFTYEGRIPTSDPAGAVEAGVVIERLNMMAAEVDPAAPWASDSAGEWDRQTFRTWMESNMATPGGRSLAELAIEAIWACDPDDVALLHVLFYIASAMGDLNLLINTTGGAQQDRFVGGSQEVVIRHAAALGDRVVLAAPVRRITQDAGRVTVEADGVTVRAQRAIVALPLHLAGRIETSPPVGALRDQLTQRMPMGSVIKAMAVYDTPFWRDDGLAGQATSDTGPVKLTFDNTPPSGTPGVLMGFFEADAARKWSTRSREERRDAFLESSQRYFGDQALEATHYLDLDWQAQPYSGGGYVGFTAPGVLTRYGEALRAPVGRLHWAGTETATTWNGYMDGAIRSGERAGAEVVAVLDEPTSPPPPAEETEPPPLPTTGAGAASAAAGAALATTAAVVRRRLQW
ncbi:MAG: FAD-dependent oxidoreductase [Actinobacteria bacterium]|nr:FAD-dependent oxidoreductase [Actinomycetota bacterium]